MSAEKQVSPGHHYSPQLKAMLDSGSYVVTPGGPRHRGLVHVLAPGEAVTKSRGTLKKLNLASTAMTDLVSLEALGAAAPTFGSGWITYASWRAASDTVITALTTTWTVPAAPTSQSGQLVYLFNGLQDEPGSQILQPVLQWGVSPDGGGPFWSVASWFVDPNGHAFKSPTVAVNEGDTLTGVMMLTGRSEQGFNYSCEFVGIGETTLRTVSISQMVNPVVTLECYAIQSCANYPNIPKTTMRAIGLDTSQGPLTPRFAASDDITDCGQHAIVVSNSPGNGEVDLYYRQAATSAV